MMPCSRFVNASAGLDRSPAQKDLDAPPGKDLLGDRVGNRLPHSPRRRAALWLAGYQKDGRGTTTTMATPVTEAEERFLQALRAVIAQREARAVEPTAAGASLAEEELLQALREVADAASRKALQRYRQDAGPRDGERQDT